MPEPLQIIAYPDRQSWLEARRLVICSSDAPGIMGESNWSSAVSLNYQKRGLIPFATDEDEDRLEDLDWHRRRESEIADWWSERLMPKAVGPARLPDGVAIWDPGDFAIAYRTVSGIPLGATNDRIILRGLPPGPDEWVEASDGTRAILLPQERILAPLELKNAHSFMSKHWEEEPPLVYLLQCQHQQIVCGTSFGYIAASLGGQPPVWAWLHRDGEIVATLLSAYRMFWDAVVADEDVSADHREVTAKAISTRFPADDGDTVQLGNSALRKWTTRQSAAQTIAGYEKLRDEVTNELRQMIGPASFAAFPNGTVVSYKADKRGRRQLRLVSSNDSPTDQETPNGDFPF